MILPKDLDSEFMVHCSAEEEHELLADNGSVLRSTARENLDKEEDGDEVKTSYAAQEIDGTSIRTKDGIVETDMSEEEQEKFKNQWQDLWRPILK